jgi:hypothetical protein
VKVPFTKPLRLPPSRIDELTRVVKVNLGAGAAGFARGPQPAVAAGGAVAEVRSELGMGPRLQRGS